MWGCFLMSGVKILHYLKDWWKSIPIHQNYTMALRTISAKFVPFDNGCIYHHTSGIELRFPNDFQGDFCRW